MRILLTGGGTGGHITPLLAVARELKRQQPDCHIIYVGERNGKFADIMDGNPDIDEIRTIFAGKFRRYHGESWLTRLLDIKTILWNLRDALYIALGTLQSIMLLKRLHPDVVFLKGGFIGVPIGFSAALWRIPFVTHDSDALPGLANRLVGRWAAVHATGMPPEFYNYPVEKMRYVGVLVSDDFKLVTPELKREYRQNLAIPETGKVLLVTGGSHGAQRLNEAFLQIVRKLLDDFSDLYVVHQVGKGHMSLYETFTHERLMPLEFMRPMYQYLGTADVVVTRAGANTLAELGVQGKACIVVPNPTLTGGHQLKNAEDLVRKEAVIAVDERAFKQSTEQLDRAIRDLLMNDARREALAAKLHGLAIPDAARKLAMVLLESADKK